MSLIRLLETSTFRLALIYLALFGVSALTLLGFLYIRTAGVIQQQTEDTINAEISGLGEQYRTLGLAGLKQAIDRRSAFNPNRTSVYLLTDRSGTWLAGNLEGWPPSGEPKPGEWMNFEIEVPDGEKVAYRRALGTTFRLRGDYRLLVGREIENLLRTESLIQKAIGWGVGLTLLLGLAGGFLMSRGMLGRIDAINRTTRRIMAGDLSQRISLKGSRDEFDVLASNLNDMLDQIERLLQGMREVTDNIAHDLRTPLSRMRSRIEVALLADPNQAEARSLLEQTLVDADAMIQSFNALLSIARAEAGSERAAFEPVDLSELAGDLADLYGPLAEEKDLSFASSCPPGLMLQGNRHLLAQALANLLDNAIKYTPAGGRVSLHAAPGPIITVADTGPGIPESARERVLERFVRLDGNRSTPGNGLGLSLVNAVAKLHGADLRLEDNHPGLRVSLVLSSKQPQQRAA
ncbi:MAG: HAMP domain-containing sensor histidine kinase [Pseudomonadota bacterium]